MENSKEFRYYFEIVNCSSGVYMELDGTENIGDICNSTLGEDVPVNVTSGALTGLNILVMSITSLILMLIILATIIGNLFVIIAVHSEKNLQNIANRLIVSLALADCLVGFVVMPVSAINEVVGHWVLGRMVCYIWTSSDVLLCTASILHLLAIAIDRYHAVTDIEYIRNRNKTRINIMILLIWLVGAGVSLPPLLGWKDPGFDQRIEIDKRCMVSQDVFYQIFATMATFYIPLLLLLFLYWRIWKEARKRIRHRPGGRVHLNPNDSNFNRPSNSAMSLTPSNINGSRDQSTTDMDLNPTPELELTPDNQRDQEESHLSDLASPSTVESIIDQDNPGHSLLPHSISYENNHLKIPMTTLSPSPTTPSISIISSGDDNQRKRAKRKRKNKETIEYKREKKAAQTLAIITGAFVISWLPFFLMALILPLCGDSCYLPDYVQSIFLWLGYFNSTCNPILYTMFSPEFRQAFKKILFGRKQRK